MHDKWDIIMMDGPPAVIDYSYQYQTTKHKIGRKNDQVSEENESPKNTGGGGGAVQRQSSGKRNKQIAALYYNAVPI